MPLHQRSTSEGIEIHDDAGLVAFVPLKPDCYASKLINLAALFVAAPILQSQNAKMLAALELIAALEPGSRGAYSKFVEAQNTARAAIAKAAPEEQ